MIPDFTAEGILPPGIHEGTWDEVVERFGFTEHRRRLLSGLRRAISALHAAGCRRLYLDGSFVTSKMNPGDFDACWEEAGVDDTKLDPVLLDFDDRRAKQKLKYGGELFPANASADQRGLKFVRFFQLDKETGEAKGIVALSLDRWQP